MNSLPAIQAGPLPARGPDTPAKIKDAAAQFEGLLIAHMLRSAREAGTDEQSDASGASLLDVAEQHFAQLLAARGGVGLARLVTQGLEKQP